MLPLRAALGLLAAHSQSTPCLLLNGSQHPDLSPLAVVQPHRALRTGLHSPDWDGKQTFNQVCLLATPSRQETLEYLALAWQALAPGGELLFCVENSLGADGWRKRLRSLQPELFSKYHCRLMRFRDQPFPEELLPRDGDPRKLRKPLESSDFVSCPGLFSWDRLDAGTQRLIDHLPTRLPGIGADFGCGPGLLVREVLKRQPTRVDAIDVDQRALAACLENNPNEERLRTLWLDLCQERPDPQSQSQYDWVVLNPPFHGLGRELRGLGFSILGQALKSLKPSGQLWLVANQDLPYEGALAEAKWTPKILHQSGGYKVMQCQRNV